MTLQFAKKIQSHRQALSRYNTRCIGNLAVANYLSGPSCTRNRICVSAVMMMMMNFCLTSLP